MRSKTSAALTAATLLVAGVLSAAPARADDDGDAAPLAPSGRTDPNNPTAPLVQVQIQDWYNTRLSGIDGQSNLVLIRPVLPFAAFGSIPSEIARPAIPIITTPDGRTALGDISGLDLFFVVDKPNLRIGIGPTVVLPTATYRRAGQGLWQAGPAAAVVYTGEKGLLLGLLVQNPISFAGPSDRGSASKLAVQPIIVKNLQDGWFLRFDPVVSVDWTHQGATTIPLNIGIGRVFKLGQQRINAYIQPEWTVQRPRDAPQTPRFTLRFAVHLLYPKTG
ncbi:MAG TPA: hypothetical protein VHN39_01900 [Phenylobacterium sp.]|jgi:hypothetical protein|nr:hypothetical protein [Phenylobacterium sp.]